MSLQNLSQKASDLLMELGSFLSILLLGILIAILFALPWILRGLAALSWFVAGFFAVTQIGAIYGPTLHSPIPVFALQFAVILILLAWPVVGMLQSKKEYIWGLLAACALVVGGLFWKVIPWLRTAWPETANLVLSLLPSVAFIVLLVSMTLRLKWLYSIDGMKLTSPAFVWLKHRAPGDPSVVCQGGVVENDLTAAE